MGDSHVGHGSFNSFQAEDIFHQLDHFGAGKIFEVRGDALNGAAQIAQTMGAMGALGSPSS